MSTAVWVIGGIALFDLMFVAWLVLRDVVSRRRRLREIHELDALWRASPSAGAGRRSATALATVGVSVGRTERAPAGSMRKATFSMLVTVLVALGLATVSETVRPDEERATVPVGATRVGPGSIGGDEPSGPSDGRTAEPGSGGGPQVGTATPTREGVTGSPTSDPGPWGAPESVEAAARSSAEIVVEWDPVPEATGYVLDRREESSSRGGADWSEVEEVDAGRTTFTDDAVEPATTYFYRVSSVMEGGTEVPSDVVSATTPPAPPAAPVVEVTVSGSTVTLVWADVEGETGYRVERSTDDGAVWVSIATTGQDVTSHDDGNLTPGTYAYRIVATNEGGESPPSNVAVVVVEQLGSGTSVAPSGSQPIGAPAAVAPDEAPSGAQAIEVPAAVAAEGSLIPTP